MVKGFAWRRVAAVLPSALSTAAGLFTNVVTNQPFLFGALVVVCLGLLLLDVVVRDGRPLHRPELYALLEGAHAALGLTTDDRVCVYRRALFRPGVLYQFTPYAPHMKWGTGRAGFPESKGIVGCCFRQGIAVAEFVDEGKDFETRMIKKWGFTHDDLNRMNRRQRAFLCIPVLDTDGRTPKAVIYIDSPRQEILSGRVDRAFSEVAVRLASML